MFALCIAQIGPLLVLLGATAWAFYTSAPAGASSCWSGRWSWAPMDNFLRPVLIKRGADLPLMLIFAGVIGGLVAFGIVGIFVGPVILAVAYTLIDDWVSSRRRRRLPPADAGAGPGPDKTQRILQVESHDDEQISLP